MSSTARRVLVGLGAALVLLPLGLRRPGVPMGLRADEASHYLLARSLAHDGDAAVTAVDLDRYFREFPYSEPLRLTLGLELGRDSDSPAAGDVSPRFAVRPLYALLLVPWVAVGRADAAFAFNALCFVLALALLGRHVLRARRENESEAGVEADDGLSWALAGGGLFLSAAFVYVQWIHPASLHLLLVAAAFGLGWSPAKESRRLPRSPLPGLVAGLCLGLAAAEAPWLAALAPAFLCRGRVASKLLGLAGGVVLALAASWLVLGHASPAGFAETTAFVASTPDELPTWDGHATDDRGMQGLLPAAGVATTARRLVLALFDGRRGLLALFPFALLALLPLAGAVRRRRMALGRVAPGGDARLLLAGLAAIVLSRPFATPYDADLARYGDPLLVAAAPAFFVLLLPRVRVRGRASSLAVLATGFVAALALLPTILTPYLPPVPSGDAHHATRGGILSLLPTGLEEVAEAGGFALHELGGSDGLRLWLPPWTHEARTEGFAFLGGVEARGWLELPADADPAGVHLLLRNFAPRNRVEVALGGDEKEIHFPGDEPPESTRIRLAPHELRDARRRGDDAAIRVARFILETSTGEKPFWRTGTHRDHYTGVELFVLGTDAHLERDVFAVEWLGCGAPPRLAPGEEARILARLRNASEETWNADGAARVRLAHRWRSAERVVGAPGRAELPEDAAPGDVILAWVDVRAPAEPGEWRLEIEPIYEWVAWFSDRADGAICTVEVGVGA